MIIYSTTTRQGGAADMLSLPFVVDDSSGKEVHEKERENNTSKWKYGSKHT